MDENVDAALRFGALQLALVTAIHLWVGWQRLFAYIQAGAPFVDPLQVLFVSSALAVLAELKQSFHSPQGPFPGTARHQT
jgi:hypothetical protein